MNGPTRWKRATWRHVPSAGKRNGQPLTHDPDAGLLIQDLYVPWVADEIPGYSGKKK